jgi:lysophospholipase L1-like esterase
MAIGGSMLQNTAPTTATNGQDRFLKNVVANILNPAIDTVYIMYGVNDLRYNNVNYTVGHYQTALEYITDYLLGMGMPNANIVLASPSYLDPSKFATTPAPFNAGSVAKQDDYVNAVIATKNSRGVKYAGVYEYMLANGANALLTADGTHPNDSGYSAITTAMLAAAF